MVTVSNAQLTFISVTLVVMLIDAGYATEQMLKRPIEQDRVAFCWLLVVRLFLIGNVLWAMNTLRLLYIKT